MDFDINNYLDSDSRLSYSELNELLKNKSDENKEKFIKGYLSYLEKDARYIYNKNKYVFYDYDFNDFFQDCILLVYKVYNCNYIYEENSQKCIYTNEYFNKYKYINKFRWPLISQMTALLKKHNSKMSKNNLKKEFFTLCDKLGEIPNIDEIREMLDLSYNEAVELLNIVYPLNSDEIEMVYENPEKVIIELENKKELKEYINGALGLLSKVNRDALKCKYGIINDNELNYTLDREKKDSDVARILGVSRQNIGAKKEVSLALIKRSSYGRKLKNLYDGE